MLTLNQSHSITRFPRRSLTLTFDLSLLFHNLIHTFLKISHWLSFTHMITYSFLSTVALTINLSSNSRVLSISSFTLLLPENEAVDIGADVFVVLKCQCGY